MRVLNCIICGNKAEIWTGHVHEPQPGLKMKHTRLIGAGFCLQHQNSQPKDKKQFGCEGCFGYLTNKHSINNVGRFPLKYPPR